MRVPEKERREKRKWKMERNVQWRIVNSKIPVRIFRVTYAVLPSERKRLGKKQKHIYVCMHVCMYVRALRGALRPATPSPEGLNFCKSSRPASTMKNHGT